MKLLTKQPHSNAMSVRVLSKGMKYEAAVSGSGSGYVAMMVKSKHAMTYILLP